jgi:hypothetical protein
MLRIPIELRLRIYRLLLVSPESIEVNYDRQYANYADGQPTLKSQLPAGSAAILRVSKQIHAEAEDILYKSNHFAFLWRAHYQVPLFLTSISSHAYSVIAKLHLSLDGESYQYLDLLTGCTGVQSLTISHCGSKRVSTDQIAILSGLRVKDFRVVKHWCGPESEIHSLTFKITGSLRQSRAQAKRAAETRDEKVSNVNFLSSGRMS